MLGLTGPRMPPLRLEGPSIALRPPQRRDQEQWIDLRRVSREFLEPWEPSWPHDATSRAAFQRRLERFAADWREQKGYAFFLFRRHDRKLVGGITLSNIRRGVSQSASIGYWMGLPYSRQGFMSEAVLLTVRFAFDELGLHRVEAACLPHNAASRGLLRKVGFREEGVAREYLCINGKWQDHVLHAILRSDPRAPLGLPSRGAVAVQRSFA